MIDFIDKIPGPDFLAYFAEFSAVCILLGRYLAGRGGSIGYPMPELTRFDPVAIAALRGGWTEAVKTAVFHLWIRKMIAIRGTNNGTEMSMIETRNSPSNNVEREILEFLREPRRPIDLFINGGLRARIKGHLKPVNEELQKARLTRTRRESKRAWLVTLAGVCLIGWVGASKVFLGMESRGLVTILVILVLIALLAFVAAVKPTAALSQLGQRYLKALKTQFEWVRHELEELKVPDGIDSSIAIALFGVGVLPTTTTRFAAGTAHGDFRAAFATSKSDETTSMGRSAGSWGGWGSQRARGGCGGCGGCGDGGCGGGCGGCGGCG